MVKWASAWRALTDGQMIKLYKKKKGVVQWVFVFVMFFFLNKRILFVRERILFR